MLSATCALRQALRILPDTAEVIDTTGGNLADSTKLIATLLAQAEKARGGVTPHGGL
jgi:hypothetical protein